MAAKRRIPIVDLPPVSSPEEEEEEEDERSSNGEEEKEEEESSSEDNLPKHSPLSSPQTPTSKKPKLNSQPEPQSKSCLDDETESESDVPHKRAPAIKPTTSKQAPDAPSKSSKRARETTDQVAKASKRTKADNPGVVNAVEKLEDKKKLFQRVWSEDDEIAVLTGWIEFAQEREMDPAKDMNGFFEFIKKSLHFNATSLQLKDKVSKLKKKFVTQVNRGKEGVEKKFASSHDQKCFDLAMKIWGSDGVSSGGAGLVQLSEVKSNGKAMKNGKDKKLEALKVDFGLAMPKENERKNAQILNFNQSILSAASMEELVMRGLDTLEEEKKAEMDKRWRKFHVAELELYVKRLELLKEQAELVLAKFKIGEGED